MKKTFCSWSGGKDSCLALNRAITQGFEVKYLVTMFDESGFRSRSHGVSLEVMKKQAECLGIELITPVATWQDYEQVFIETLKDLKTKGCNYGVFGDIDLQEHRDWEEKVCQSAGIEAVLPLWDENRTDLVNEFLDEGFKAVTICINEKFLDKSFCGRFFNENFISDLPENADLSGENGEFHTFVFDGKLFSKPIDYRIEEIYQHSATFITNNPERFYYAKLALNDIS